MSCSTTEGHFVLEHVNKLRSTLLSLSLLSTSRCRRRAPPKLLSGLVARRLSLSASRPCVQYILTRTRLYLLVVCCTRPRAISSPGLLGSARLDSIRESCSCSCTLGGGTQALGEFAAPPVRTSVRPSVGPSVCPRPASALPSVLSLLSLFLSPPPPPPPLRLSTFFVHPSFFFLLCLLLVLPSHPRALDDYFPFPSRRPRRVTCKSRC